MNANESGISYTEDNIPIRSITVGNISSKVTEKELKEYFERFGSVVSVTMNRRDTPDEPHSYALVTFTEPQSATKVLHDEMHWILGEPTKVKAVDTYEETHEDQCSLLNLNDDCLFSIASFLEFSDLLNISKSCKRLEYVANVTFASCKSLDILSFMNLPLMRVRKILSRIGPQVEQITCRTLNAPTQTDFVRLLPEYCSSVKLFNLTLTKIWVGDCVYRVMIGAFKYLKTLKLQDCYISDNVCAVLHNCADLETLDLSENLEITGRHLDRLANLQTLNLKCCANLQPNFFNALCRQTKLVSLNIQRCDNLDQTEFETLATTQDKLEDLSVSHSYVSTNLVPLTRLKSLKRLTIRCNFNISDTFFQQLARNRGADLEVLKITRINFNWKVQQAFCELKNLKELSIPRCKGIDSSFLARLAKSAPLEHFSSVGCNSVCNEGISNLIRFSDTITKINVSLCKKICPELVTSAVEILKTKKIKKPLTLVAGRTNIFPIIMLEPTMLNNSHLLNLKLNYKPMPFDHYEDNDYSWSIIRG